MSGGRAPKAWREPLPDRAECGGLRIPIVIVPGDVTLDSVRSAIVAKTVERWGKIDILINNAGRGSYYPASTTPLDEARAVFDLNFFAPLALSQLALPFLRQTRGTLVNIASIAGEISLPWLPVYSASKFALAGITAAQRTEFRRDGVHVMGVFPGYVNTDFQAHATGQRPPARVVQGKRFAVSAEECTEAIIHGMTHQQTDGCHPSFRLVAGLGEPIFPVVCRVATGTCAEWITAETMRRAST